MISGVGQQSIIIAGQEYSETEELLSFCEGVNIQDNFFLCFQCSVLTAMNGVVLALFCTGIIKVLAPFNRRRSVVLFQMAQHLIVELFTKRLERLHDRVGILVFSL